MIYDTTFNIYDKSKELIQSFPNRVCFAVISETCWAAGRHYSGDIQACKEKGAYLEYDFHNARVNQKDMVKYFLFLKSIPEFAPYMPKSCTELARTKKYWIDMRKVNGLKVFVMLTVIRAVVEDKDIVLETIKFNRNKKYSISNLAILRMCGAVYKHNSGHWLTGSVDRKNIAKTYRDSVAWKSEKPMTETGLIGKINGTFEWNGDGYYAANSLNLNDIKKIRKEHEVINPKVKAIKQDTNLILDF